MRSDPDSLGLTERLRAHVQQDPGITKSELRRCTGLAWGTICHHIERLVADGDIQIHAGGKHQHLFPADLSETLMRRQVVLRRPHARDLLGLFERCRELDIPRAMDETGLSRRIVSTRLSELEGAGLIERRGAGRPRYARPSEAGFRPRRRFEFERVVSPVPLYA